MSQKTKLAVLEIEAEMERLVRRMALLGAEKNRLQGILPLIVQPKSRRKRAQRPKSARQSERAIIREPGPAADTGRGAYFQKGRA